MLKYLFLGPKFGMSHRRHSRHSKQELRILKALLYKEKVATTKLAKILNTTVRSMSPALKYLRENGLVNYEKHGRNVFNELSERGKIVSRMVLDVVERTNPEYYSLVEVPPNILPSKIEKWFKKARKIAKVGSGYSISDKNSHDYLKSNIDDLKCSNYADSCYDLIIFSAFEEAGIPLKIVREHITPLTALRFLLDGKIDIALLPLACIEDVARENPKVLNDVLPLCIFAPYGWQKHPSPSTCVIINPKSKGKTIFYPENANYRKRVAEVVSKRFKMNVSSSGSEENREIVKGFLCGDFKSIVTYFPYDVLLRVEFGAKRIEGYMDPGVIVMSKNAFDGINRRDIEVITSMQYEAYRISLKKSWQYKKILDFVIKEIPKKLLPFKGLISSLDFLF